MFFFGELHRMKKLSKLLKKTGVIARKKNLYCVYWRERNNFVYGCFLYEHIKPNTRVVQAKSSKGFFLVSYKIPLNSNTFKILSMKSETIPEKLRTNKGSFYACNINLQQNFTSSHPCLSLVFTSSYFIFLVQESTMFVRDHLKLVSCLDVFYILFFLASHIFMFLPLPLLTMVIKPFLLMTEQIACTVRKKK